MESRRNTVGSDQIGSNSGDLVFDNVDGSGRAGKHSSNVTISETRNDIKRELSYEDYYGSSETPSKKRKTKNIELPFQGLELPQENPLELLDQRIRQHLSLNDADLRRRAHIPDMLKEASRIAQDSIHALFEDELIKRSRSLQRRHSFVIHPERLPAAQLPEASFHESLSDIGVSKISQAVDSSHEQRTNTAMGASRSFLVQTFDMPCWRKPVTSTTSTVHDKSGDMVMLEGTGR